MVLSKGADDACGICFLLTGQRYEHLLSGAILKNNDFLFHRQRLEELWTVEGWLIGQVDGEHREIMGLRKIVATLVDVAPGLHAAEVADVVHEEGFYGDYLAELPVAGFVYEGEGLAA